MSTVLRPLAGNQNLKQVIKGALIGANVVIELGKVYVSVGGYLVVPAAGNAATGKRPVIALDSVDNTGGADGAASVDVMYGTWIDMANDGTHPITQADVLCTTGYLSSATTVSTNSADGPPCGPVGSIIEFNQAGQISGRPVRIALF